MSAKLEVELPGRSHPVVAALAFLPIVVVVIIVAGFAIEPIPPVPLLLLLLTVAGCCIGLTWTALPIVLGGKLEFTSEGLTISRLLSAEVYPWGTLEACKVIPATGTFGDDPLTDLEDRVGLGLFIRGSERERAHDLDADVIICAGEKLGVQRLMQIAAKVETTIKKANAPNRRPAPRAPQPGGRRQFQQRRGAAPAAAADPVAQFRQRAAT